MELNHITHRSDTPYRADIDGLRAIAVLSVLAFHAFPSLLKGGFIGVDIFFVISGYLISRIIISGLKNGTFSAPDFYGQRIRRIFPCLFAVMLTCLGFAWLALTPSEYKQLGLHTAGGAGFVSNFILWNESGYFDNTAETKPLLHLWSLGVEEQFYIFWPFFLWLAWKKKASLFKVTVVVAVASFVLNLIETRARPVGAFYLPQTRFWELMIGSALAYLAVSPAPRLQIFKETLLGRLKAGASLENSTDRGEILNNLLSVCGAILIGSGLFIINKDRHFPGSWALLPTAGAAFVIGAGEHAWLNRKILSNRILVWFGLISFPLYLWHYPLLAFPRIIERGEIPVSLRVSLCLASIALAWTTYKVIEKPIRFGQHKTAKAFILVVGLTLVGSAGYACFLNNGFEDRIDPKLIELNRLYAEYPHQRHNDLCDNTYPVFKDFSACMLSRPAAPAVALVGDSHSNQLFGSLARQLPDVPVINVASWSCLPFASKAHQIADNCENGTKLALDFLTKSQSIKAVILAGYWSYLESGGYAGIFPGWARPLNSTSEQANTFRSKGEEFLKPLLAANKQVVLILDIPDLDFDVQTCLNFRPLRISDKLRTPCAIDRASYEKRVAQYDQVLSMLLKEFPQLVLFDPKGLFCDAKYCWAMKNDKPLYFNGDHLTPYGADLVVQKLLAGTKLRY